MPVIPTGKALLDATQILKEAGIRSGMKVADLGCGTSGHFTFPAAHMVGEEGKVYAVDILKGALAGIESRSKIEQTTNVEPLWADIERLGGVRLPDGSIDLALVVNITALAKKSASFPEEVRRLVKSGGKLLLVDWKPDAPPFGSDPATRVNSKEIRKVFTDHGFVAITEFDAGPNHWGLIMKKQAE